MNCFWLMNRKTFHKPAEFLPGETLDLGSIPWPLKAERITLSFFQPFVKKAETIAFLSDYSDKKAYPQTFVIRTF
jgi:hypothetical protein